MKGVEILDGILILNQRRVVFEVEGGKAKRKLN